MNSIQSKLAKSRAKLEKDVARLAWREMHGFSVTFTSEGNPETKPLPPQLQFVRNVGDYCARRIVRSINRTKAKGTNARLYGKGENPLSSAPFIAKKRVSDETRKKSDGNFFQFSPCDMEEIYSITAMVLTEERHFDETSDYIYKYAVDRSTLDVIVNEIKSIDGLELNRFKRGKNLSLESIIAKNHDDMENPALVVDILPELKKTLREQAIEKIGVNNEDYDSLQEKIDAIHAFLDAYHDASDSRKKESLRKSDKEFFTLLLTCTATGDGKTTREAFLMQAKRFLDRLVTGYNLLLENTDNGTRFNSFDHLAVLFNSLK